MNFSAIQLAFNIHLPYTIANERNISLIVLLFDLPFYLQFNKGYRHG